MIKRIFKIIKLSIRGETEDYTQGRVSKALLLLALPMMLEMATESLFAVVDIYFVAKLGNGAVSVVGLTESVMIVIYAIGSGLAVASSAIISRRTGEKNILSANKTALQAIITTLIISVFISVPGWIFSKEILQIMGAADNIIAEGSSYTSIAYGTSGILMLLFVISSIFRSSGDPVVPMYILWIANILNIILDPVFIFGFWFVPAMGIKGAAIATSLGRGIALLALLIILFKGNRKIKLYFNQFIFDFKIISQILKLSTSSIAQYLISTSSWIIMIRILTEFGNNVVAGYTVAVRIAIFVLLPAFGLSSAAATLVGQNLGAKKINRAVKSVWIAGIVNSSFLFIVSFILILFDDFFIGIFVNDPIVIQKGSVALTYISFGSLSYALGMVLIQSINGAGDTKTPLFISLTAFWLVEIPLAYLLALKFNFYENGVYFSIVFSESLATIIAILVFKQGKWKMKSV